MKQYIIESASRAQLSIKEHVLFSRIIVQVTDPLPPQINLKKVLKMVESKVPKHLLRDVDSIYIGKYEALEKRQVDSIFVNGSILITNNQPSEEELFKTIIHEIAHAAEELASNFIYADGDLSREFIAKRKTLYNLLKDDYELNKKDFLSINFSQSFDDLAYKEIGYDNLGVITNGLFISPYACTSLREYFANGFENYFTIDDRELRQISPGLVKKIEQILDPYVDL